jgi:DNA ligase (NAD+)
MLGTIVQAATLHNANYIKDLDLRINDIVLIKKAGDIIPKVISVNMSERTNQKK